MKIRDDDKKKKKNDEGKKAKGQLWRLDGASASAWNATQIKYLRCRQPSASCDTRIAAAAAAAATIRSRGI